MRMVWPTAERGIAKEVLGGLGAEHHHARASGLDRRR